MTRDKGTSPSPLKPYYPGPGIPIISLPTNPTPFPSSWELYLKVCSVQSPVQVCELPPPGGQRRTEGCLPPCPRVRFPACPGVRSWGPLRAGTKEVKGLPQGEVAPDPLPGQAPLPHPGSQAPHLGLVYRPCQVPGIP